MSKTTIQIDSKLLDKMKNLKEYPRQTYSELLEKMIKIYEYNKSHNQYDEFLHKIQQQKMKELWDNSEDEDWDNV
ncbi:MAG: hypothetical protein HeimC3_21950 [Candidatus Heimdallarchaeota archaeon LC_3]|nr:MAG: hypothetical protein HeimC3_21950 [Candidatus Heimdallarchaeota archaeon LC_3]